MATIQIAVDTAYVTRKEFLRRTGIAPRTFDELLSGGDIPIKPKQRKAVWFSPTWLSGPSRPQCSRFNHASYLSDSNKRLLPLMASYIRLGSYLRSTVAIRIADHGQDSHVQFT
jgi:hypothetical protein